MITKPSEFYKHYQYAIEISRAEGEKKTKQQSKKDEEKPLVPLTDFSDTHLFMINFVERQYKCSKYIDQPKNTKEVLRDVNNQETATTAD